MGWFDRFTKPLWGVGGQKQDPVDAQADAGFAFLGNEPPSVELFNSVFQWLDGKDKWLYQQIAAVLQSANIAPTETNVTALRDALLDQFQSKAAWPSTFRRNHLMNGEFNVRQRGDGPFTQNGVCYDRWHIGVFGGSFSCIRMNATEADRVELGDNRLYQFLRVTVNGGPGASDFALIGQRIENVLTLNGQYATASLAVRRVSGSGNIGLCFDQLFGPDTNEFGSNIVPAIGAVQVPVTNTWARKTVTANIPPVGARAISNLGSALQLSLWFSAGSARAARSANIGSQAAVFDISMTQVEDGQKATNFDWQPGDLDYLRCRRHYANPGPSPGGFHMQNNPTSLISQMASFSFNNMIPMARAPLMVMKKNTWAIVNPRGDAVFPNVRFDSLVPDEKEYRVTIRHDGAFPVAEPFVLNDASYMGFDAEFYGT